MHMTICAQNNCSICCHDREVVLTHEDVSKLLTMGHYEQTFARPSRHGHNLKELVFLGGECIFHKLGKCSVYYNRPTACRIFPMTLQENGPGLDNLCPHCSEFKTDEEFIAASETGLNRIITDVQRTLSTYNDIERKRNKA